MQHLVLASGKGTVHLCTVLWSAVLMSCVPHLVRSRPAGQGTKDSRKGPPLQCASTPPTTYNCKQVTRTVTTSNSSRPPQPWKALAALGACPAPQRQIPVPAAACCRMTSRTEKGQADLTHPPQQLKKYIKTTQINNRTSQNSSETQKQKIPKPRDASAFQQNNRYAWLDTGSFQYPSTYPQPHTQPQGLRHIYSTPMALSFSDLGYL